ncbi:MAG TPA: transporter substrate-binding domain-containing protein [Gaiellaceae bacterium]|nr:transporter substrate-binding domain-containing protein [Gaiellaceae bacterium]
MKRLLLVIAVIGVAAAAFAAWGAAAPWSVSAPDKATAASKLPALPAEVKERKRWKIGVKCDFPPFGYIGADGKKGGYDVDVAKRFATLAFGKSTRVSMECVTTPSRIPALMSKRVDIIISTLTYTLARDQQIDFSIPYYDATGRLLVRNDTNIANLGALAGKTVVTTRGSIYDSWIRNCFSDTKLLVLDSTTSATLALKDRRADTFMFDDALLLGIAANDPQLKLTTQKFLNLPWGIGIRQGETEMKAWVDAAVRLMKKNDEFATILKKNAPRRFWKEFLTNVPRPKGKAIVYPTVSDPSKLCP